MLTGRVIVGVFWLAILIVIAGAWSAGASRGRHEGAPSSGTRTILAPDGVTNSEAFGAADAAPPRLDLYGNEVHDAVGDYRIDVRGDVYERHSPDTEVTQLAAPSL